MAESDPLLAARDIHTYYGDSYVLHGLSLQLAGRQDRRHPRPQRHGQDDARSVRSPGLTPPRRGEITFEGRSLNGLPPYSISQAGIAIVPQGRRIFKSLTVRENLLLPTSAARPQTRHAQSGRKHWNLAEVLKAFPQLAERIDHAGGALSGGEQQMLAIGRALMANPVGDPDGRTIGRPFAEARRACRDDPEQPARRRACRFSWSSRTSACDVGCRLHLRHFVGTICIRGNAVRTIKGRRDHEQSSRSGSGALIEGRLCRSFHQRPAGSVATPRV